jgi:DNA-binding NtrC family response regulator
MSIHSPNVSANHVRVSNLEPGVTEVVDLGSRNGTWLRLPAFESVTVRGDAPLGLVLALPNVASRSGHTPEDAIWKESDDYSRAVMHSVEDWLRRCELEAEVLVVSRNETRVEGLWRVPLAPDCDLVVSPLHTMDTDWLDVLVQIERYVVRQNALFIAEQQAREEGLILASPSIRQALARVVTAASSGAKTLLLLGPSGAGKEGLARCFHRHSRASGRFVPRNCAMLRQELVRSELFGAEKGAYTGAVQRVTGAVETANEGTLFLDEVGDLPLEIQPMLLRFLDHGEYERLGRYGQTSQADVRIVCATNKDLRSAALAGLFRTDLWFRLSACVVEVPPLRERFEDVEAYLRSRTLSDGSSLFDALAPESVAMLREHRWQGNFRELVNFAERLVALGSRGRFRVEQTERALAEGSLEPTRVSAVSTKPASVPVRAGADDWQALAATAVQAFAEDHEGAAPHAWDEVKDLIENYLKPLLFARLSGADRLASREAVELKAAAESVRADRGTAGKQLQRYFERFSKSPGL